MRQMSHQTGTQIAETIKMTTARRSGPATPKPRPATGRSTTPTCVRPFPRKSPPPCNGSRPRIRQQASSGTKPPEESRWMWGGVQAGSGHPDERPPIERPLPTAWLLACGSRDRYLGRADNGRVEAACDRIAELERDKISRRCVPWKAKTQIATSPASTTRLKGRDRIKEKIYDTMEESPTSQLRTPSQLSRTRFGTRLTTVRLTTLRVSGRTSRV